MKTSTALSAIAFSLLLVPALARAHVEVASGPGIANTSQEITFTVGHGCSGTDTYSVTIDLPESVTTVRAETSDFGRATVNRDNANKPISVTWQKPDADLLASDDNFYKLVMRIKVPNAPFTTLYFPTHQTCKVPGGATSTVDWVSTTSEGEPAPSLKIIPSPKTAGWNKWTAPVAIADVSVYFKDALIVWKGNSAYSSNANTAALIAATPGVTALTSVEANDELWVKY